MENGRSKRDNPVKEKSFAFALRAVKLAKYLQEDKCEFVPGGYAQPRVGGAED